MSAKWERVKADPERLARTRELNRAAAARYAKRHRMKLRRKNRRRYAAMKADPERYARYLETRRIYWHLQQERKGRKPSRRSSTAANGWRPPNHHRDVDEMLPTYPLLEYIADAALRAGSVEILADAIGFAPRRLRNLATQARVHVATVDRLVMAIGPLRTSDGRKIATIYDLYPRLNA